MDETKIPCPYCGRFFQRRGLPNHQKACRQKQDDEQDQARFMANRKVQQQAGNLGPQPAPDFPAPVIADAIADVDADDVLLLHTDTTPLPQDSMHPAAVISTDRVDAASDTSSDSGSEAGCDDLDDVGSEGTDPHDFNDGDDLDDGLSDIGSQSQLGADSCDPGGSGSSGDIRVKYHPGSGRQPQTFTFDEFRKAPPKLDRTDKLDQTPWAPFRTREDFEFAALMQRVKASKKDVNKLIRLFKKCINGKGGSFTLSSHKEMCETLTVASERLPKFEQQSISAPYKGKSQNFDVWIRPMWSWIEDMLQNEDLIDHFEWDACQMWRFDEGENSWIRFYDEPWTADQFWKIQSNLPKGAKPLMLSVYADKSKLSTFGTQKGYPVIARCANLPVEIRNGNGLGGGRIVGWLPIIEEDEAESQKTGYVSFKRVVWHESFRKLLASIHQYSKSGCWIPCADGQDRLIYPIILILSADYEEQCIMALIRGSNSDFPCPICLVSKEKMCKGKVYAVRTTKTMKEAYKKASKLKTVKERETHLKKCGLRGIKNVFWELGNSDPYQALSFDRLHSSHLGLFKTHLWAVLKSRVKAAGRSTIKEVDDQASAFPRWSGLTHFSPSVMGLSFSDGSKFEDLSKISVFILHNCFKAKSSSYLLLTLLRCYVEIDMYASFQLHTTQTIEQGREQVARFYPLLREYIDLEESEHKDEETPLKKWDFPKIHLQLHLFDDIIAKGVTRNYNTKTSESCHGPIRRDYLSTNFRDVAKQILHLDHMRYTVTFIQTKIDRLDAANKPPEDTVTESAGNIHLGSPKGVETVADFAKGLGDHGAATFRGAFEESLNSFYKANSLPQEQYLRVRGSDQIAEFQYLEVNYENKVNWKLCTDRLRCNACFYGQERRDYVLVNSNGHHFFAHLLRLFKFTVGERSHAFAYVETYSRPPGSMRTKDRDLGIYRLHLKAKGYEIISLQSLVRGALLVPDPKHPGEYLVVDTIDADMFLRMKSLEL